MFAKIAELAYDVYDVLLVKPLRQLYFFGPVILQYGFWAGMPNADICQTITHTPSSHWSNEGQQACANLVDNKFYSFRVLIESGVYFYCIARIFLRVWNHAEDAICVTICKRAKPHQRHHHHHHADGPDHLRFQHPLQNGGYPPYYVPSAAPGQYLYYHPPTRFAPPPPEETSPPPSPTSSDQLTPDSQ